MRASYTTSVDNPSVNVLVPGLLAAEAVGAMPVSTPFLCRCLSHARFLHDSTDSLESAVLNWFNSGDASNKNCAAILGYRLDTGLSEEIGMVLRADPVYQEMDINHAVLADQSVLDLSLAEAQSLIDTLNNHFCSDGVVFKAVEATRWYCILAHPLDVCTSPPSKATGRDVSQESPRGADASKWRSWLAEIEMLLYSHPVNQQRQQLGKVMVSSLWLWGEGSLEPVRANDAVAAVVYSDNFYTKSIAHHFSVEACALDNFAAQKLDQQSSVVVVVDELQRAAATADEQLRVDTLASLEAKIFKPLWQQLAHGGWVSARLWVGGDQWLQLDRHARYKFWRRQKPLSNFIERDRAVADDN